MSNPYADHAEAYRRAGWAGTLLLPYGKKSPPPSGFTGEGAPWVSTAQLDEWKVQGGNIALRLPADVVALDVDRLDEFVGLTKTLGPLPPTWRSVGARDPGHLYFRLPDGVSYRDLRAPCAGVDLLRHSHRYSVVWPSLHPDGMAYRWEKPSLGRAADVEDIPRPEYLPLLPDAWVQHLQGPAVVAPSAAPAGFTTWDQFSGGAPGLGDPIHDNHDDALAAYVASLVARSTPKHEALVLAMTRAADCIGGDPRRPFTERDFERWWRGAEAKFTPEAQAAELAEAILNPEEGAEDPFPVVDWIEAWNAPETESWVLEPLLAERRGAVIYSAPKMGKSLLVLEIAVKVSNGLPVLGMVPERPRRVLYVDHENDLRGDIVTRLRSMGVGPPDLGNLRYLSLPAMEALDTARGGAALLAVAQREGAELVVIDTASRTISGPENENDTWIKFYAHTGKGLKAAGIAYLRLDHTGKDETKGQRGGSAKSSDVDAIWHMTKTAENEFLLTCEAQRMGLTEAQRSIAMRRLDEPLRHERKAVPTAVDSAQELKRRVWDALDEAGITLDPVLKSGPIDKELRGLLGALSSNQRTTARQASAAHHYCRTDKLPFLAAEGCPEWSGCDHSTDMPMAA